MHIATILFTLCLTSAPVTSTSYNHYNMGGRGHVGYSHGGMRNGSTDTGSTDISSYVDGSDEHVTDYHHRHRSNRKVLDEYDMHSINEPNEDLLDDDLDHELFSVHRGGKLQLLDEDGGDSWSNTNDDVYNKNESTLASSATTAFLPRHARSVPDVRGGSIAQQVRRCEGSRDIEYSSSSGNGRGGRYDTENEHQSDRRSSRQQQHQQRQNTRRFNHSRSRAFTPRRHGSYRSNEREAMSPPSHRRRNHGRQSYYKESDIVNDHDDVPTSSSDHDSDDYSQEQEDESDHYQLYNHDDNTSNRDHDYCNTPPTTSTSSSSAAQSNLLRLPLQLHLNTPTTTSQQQHSSTPIAAYVDTGAQVTVISASAARKIGILHLLDRRYAGRATGVGECRVLGRIDAGCVKFVLGHDDCGIDNGIEMDGPALTVLEGTVTPGVDMLLGLDVLQDWEATIQIGKSRSCIMVRKRGLVDPVVLPLLVEGGRQSSSGGGRRRVKRDVPRMRYERRDDDLRHRSSSKSKQQRHQQQHVFEDEEDDDEFSPVSSDVESDLDILDQSEFTHEFPDEMRSRRRQFSDEIVQDIEREDELLGVRHSRHLLHDDEEELEDSSDEEEEAENFDMSGL